MEAEMPGRYNPILVVLSAFAISSFGGVAAALRSREDLDWRRLLGAAMYSGAIGLIVCLLWYNFFDGQDNIFFLLGISGLAGIGGANVLDILRLLWQGKLVISIKKKQDVGPDDDEEKNIVE
jgi:hypothetical protein